MPENKTRAEMLTLFIIASLPDEVTEHQAREILLASGEISPMTADEHIHSLKSRGQIYVTDEIPPQARYDAAIEHNPEDRFVGVTELGMQVVKTLEDQKLHFRSAINKALRHYKKLTCGIEYVISVDAENGGSAVSFEMFVNEKPYFSTKMFFTKSREALNVYNRIDNDPEGFYNGVMTVATGQIDYIM